MSANAPVQLLLVDDLQDNLDLLGEIFAGDPYVLLMARGAREALQIAAAAAPTLAILDVQMPETDGLELCRQLQALHNTPVLFLSANCTGPLDAVRGLNSGGCDYVAKPFSPDELRARVRAILRAQARHAAELRNAQRVVRRVFGR